MAHKPHLRLIAVHGGCMVRALNRPLARRRAPKPDAENRPLLTEENQLVTTLVVLFVGAMSGFVAAALLGLTTIFSHSFEAKLSERLANSPAFRAAVIDELQKNRPLVSTRPDRRPLDGTGFAHEEDGKEPLRIQRLTTPSDRR
jgi:hypothetical protein